MKASWLLIMLAMGMCGVTQLKPSTSCNMDRPLPNWLLWLTGTQVIVMAEFPCTWRQ
jgi:hypothetical protein